MTEKEYRIKQLKQIQNKLTGKRIALYGTGINAEELLSSFPELNILALMDGKHTGEYFYGKKIISEEEAIMLNVDTIIIAAEAGAAYIVSGRIRSFCMQNNIRLINMYGYDEFDLYRNILEQDLKYADDSSEALKREINKYDVICFQLTDVLCASRYLNKESFIHAVEEKYFAERKSEYKNFRSSRIKAEEKARNTPFYDIKDIYAVFQLITAISANECLNMCSIEQQALIDSMIPKAQMIDILNWSARNGKAVYIISELRISKEYIEKLLRSLGIKHYKGIIQENILHLTLSGGALRLGLGEDFGCKTLYIGTNEKNNLLLPQLYDMDVYLLKSAWSIMREFSALPELDFTQNERIDEVNELVQYTFNSPFIKENGSIDAEKLLSISPKMEKGQIKQKELPGLFLLPEYMDITELEKLDFVSQDRPMVSIIIPAYNQFGYTYNCMKSILQNTENVEYEVILADDNSMDETRFIEKIVRGIKIIRNKENLLFLRNCNQAARYVRGKYILFLNNDTQVQLDWLYPLVKIMEKDEDVGLVGSKLLYPDGSIQEAGGIIWKNGEACNYGRGTNADNPECNYVREVDYVTGASFMIRSDLWKEIGGFDERYAPAYCEDSDLAFEVRRHGKKVIYQPASEVVHFEGISNGRDDKTGVRACQKMNIQKLRKKWENVLEEENYDSGQHILAACDRKCNRKSVLFFSNAIPRYDCDAGSKTVYNYLKLFVKKGYIVKFIPGNFVSLEPYTMELQQMGIEVLAGAYFKNNINSWVLRNQNDIDYVFFHYPQCTYDFIRLLKSTRIKLRYYGHDLHFLRSGREYELTGDSRKKKLSEEILKKESYIIENIEKIFYPSEVEVNIVKERFKKENVKQMTAYIYDTPKISGEYRPDTRNGLMFVGGFRHAPNVDAVLWFAKEIYPLVYKNRKIPFYIIGSGAPIEIQQLDAPGIIYKGHLTDGELEEVYKMVRIAVIPLRYGAGIKGKIIEAMSYGVPLVSTSVGMEGIHEAENCAVIADDSLLFARKLLELYEDEAKLREISLAEQSNIVKYFSEDAAWDMIKEDF